MLVISKANKYCPQDIKMLHPSASLSGRVWILRDKLQLLTLWARSVLRNVFKCKISSVSHKTGKQENLSGNCKNAYIREGYHFEHTIDWQTHSHIHTDHIHARAHAHTHTWSEAVFVIMGEAHCGNAKGDPFHSCCLLQNLQGTTWIIIYTNRGRHFFDMAIPLIEGDKREWDR